MSYIKLVWVGINFGNKLSTTRGRFASKTLSLVIVGFLVLGLVVTTGYVSSEPSLQASSDSKISHGMAIPAASKLIQVSQPLAENAKEKIDPARLGTVSLPFIENQGQTDSKVKFYAKTFGGTVFVTDSSLTYSFPAKNSTSQQYQGLAVKERFISGNDLQPSGLDKSSSSVNYFVGDKKDWRSDISTYNSVSLGHAWPSIEVQLHAYGNNVEKIFSVNPGASPAEIKLAFDGINSLSVDKDGKLLLDTDLGAISMTKPVAYQDINGERKLVDVSYWIHGNTYGFVVGAYDHNYSLNIDPLLASTYIGGSSDDVTNAIAQNGANLIALDGSGNVYVTGHTTSSDYPTTVGAYNTIFDRAGIGHGGGDVFVSKLDSNLTTLVASTFTGGDIDDQPSGIALDGSGNVYVTGRTNSPNYPTTVGAYSQTSAGSFDVFVSKLDSNLATLEASTYVGGNNDDFANAIALDGSGNVYVTGFTSSPNYPTTVGAYSQTSAGSFDVFVSKLDSNLATLEASTYVGGNNNDVANAIVLDRSGNVYVTGQTNSPNYPTTVGAYSQTFGSFTVYISKLDSSLTTLVASTFIAPGEATAIALDGSGNVYVAGTAGFSYPTTVGAYGPTVGTFGIFISKLDSNLIALEASTFIGGNAHAIAIVLDSSGNVYVTGFTQFPDYPTTVGAYNPKFNGEDLGPGSGNGDVVVSKLDSSLHTLVASTFIGGKTDDIPSGIVLDGSGNVYVTGQTHSSNYPTTVGAYSPTSAGSFDLFVSKLTSDLSGNPTIPTTIPTSTIISQNPSSITSGNPINYTATVTDASVSPAALTTLKVQSTTNSKLVTLSTNSGEFSSPAAISKSSISHTVQNSSTKIRSSVAKIHSPETPVIKADSIKNKSLTNKTPLDILSRLAPTGPKIASSGVTTNSAVVFIVNSNDDVVDKQGCDSTHCSLREAIIAANSNPASFIHFSGPLHIVLSTELPTITSPVFIDGTQQGSDAPTVELTGSPSVNFGLKIAGGFSTVKGLVINSFSQVGIDLESSGNFIAGNYIGTDVTGKHSLGNGHYGVQIVNEPGNTIGGISSGDRNIISGNKEVGVVIFYPASKNNKVIGNYIGTDVTGTGPLGNTLSGLAIVGAPSNTIGGTTPGERNIISGNTESGVEIFAATGTGNVISGNYIGTDVTGAKALPNSNSGIEIIDAPSNTIGGPTAGAGNVISGNEQAGVAVFDATAAGNTIEGNYIGTDFTGKIPLGNKFSGLEINGAPSNTIGGTTPAARNIISSNEESGVFIHENTAIANRVTGNYIGTDVTGTYVAGPSLGNKFSGLEINGAPGNIIGDKIGTTPGVGADCTGSCNIISRNLGNGVTVVGALATGNSIRFNSIYGNGLLSIDLGGDGVTLNDKTDSDTGPNDLMNFPKTLKKKFVDPNTIVSGNMTALPSENVLGIDIYSSDTLGGKQSYVASVTRAEINSDGSFTKTIPGVLKFVSTTATNEHGSTSEFRLDGDIILHSVITTQGIEGRADVPVTFVKDKPTVFKAVIINTFDSDKDVYVSVTDNSVPVVGEIIHILKNCDATFYFPNNQGTPTDPLDFTCDGQTFTTEPLHVTTFKTVGTHNIVFTLFPHDTIEYDESNLAKSIVNQVTETNPITVLHVPILQNADKMVTACDPASQILFNGEAYCEPNLSRLNGASTFMALVYPTAHVYNVQLPFIFNDQNDGDGLNKLFSELSNMVSQWKSSHPHTGNVVIFGWLPTHTLNNGYSPLGSGVGIGDESLLGLGTFDDMPINQLILAHELGHGFGINHPAEDGTCASFNTPYRSLNIGTIGYNFFTGHEKDLNLIEFMEGGHCLDAPIAEEWVSPQGWNNMIGILSGVRFSSLASITSSEKSVSISGIISTDGSMGKLDPIFNTTLPLDTTSGPFTLEMLDSIGSVLHTQNFDTFKTDSFFPGSPFTREGFSFVTSLPTGTLKIQIRNATTVLDSVDVSAHAPQVQVTFPNGGETLTGFQTVTWTSSDVDGGTLTHDIQYSFDNGATWNYIAFGIPANSFGFDFDKLPGKGNTALIKVTASDGVNSNSDISDGPFFVANKPPLVGIQNPQNDTVFSPTDNVRLEGEASDVEDGFAPPDSSFTWTGDTGGILGSGRDLFIGPLLSGTHKITLTVSDSDGNKASAFTNILVTGTVIPPDTTPPVVTPPPDQKVIATSPSGALVNYPAATATDDIGVTSGPTCTPSSGSIFPLGATLVTCTATDAAHNIGTATFNVIVVVPNPTGTISWSDGGAGGTFSNSGSCILSSGSCTITYTPSTADHAITTFTPLSVGPVTITGSYSGDGTHDTSSGKTILTVTSTPPPSDTTPPIVTGTPDRPANSNGWYNGSVIITWTGTDNEPGGTGINSCDAPTTYSGPDGNSIVLTGHCTDKAGNVGTGIVAINYDSTPPTITGAPTTTPNANNWFNSDVDVKFTCTDATSLPVQSFFDLFVTLDGASQSETGTCNDNAGNLASLTVSGINLDKTPPVVTPPPDQKGTATSSSGVPVNYPASIATDNIGVKTGPSCIPTSGSTFPIGTSIVTCTATDAAGNTGSASFNVIIANKIPSDTTPPEAFNQFDPVTKTVQVFGRDASFGTSGPITPTSVTLIKEDDHENGKKSNDANIKSNDEIRKSGDENKNSSDENRKSNDKDRTELRTYQVTDHSGNSITLVEKVKKAGNEIDVQMISVKYNNGKVIKFGENAKQFEWTLDKKGAIKELEQDMKVGHDGNKQDVKAKFDSKKNKTTVTVEKPKPDTKNDFMGLVLLRMATSNGNIVIEH